MYLALSCSFFSYNKILICVVDRANVDKDTVDLMAYGSYDLQFVTDVQYPKEMWAN